MHIDLTVAETIVLVKEMVQQIWKLAFNAA